MFYCKKSKWEGVTMNKKIWDIYAPIYEKAMRGDYPANLMFEVADALHIMPEPEEALKEIDRILKLNGILIARIL